MPHKYLLSFKVLLWSVRKPTIDLPHLMILSRWILMRQSLMVRWELKLPLVPQRVLFYLLWGATFLWRSPLSLLRSLACFKIFLKLLKLKFSLFGPKLILKSFGTSWLGILGMWMRFKLFFYSIHNLYHDSSIQNFILINRKSNSIAHNLDIHSWRLGYSTIWLENHPQGAVLLFFFTCFVFLSCFVPVLCLNFFF